MSRSRYWLIALAEPAASVPPSSVQNARRSHSREVHAREVAGGEDHGRDRGDEQQLDDPGLGQRDVGADGVARAAPAGPAAVGRRRGRRRRRAARRRGAPDRRRSPAPPAGLVVARRRRAPPASAQMIAPSATWSVWVHSASPVRTWRPPIDRLDRVRTADRAAPAGRPPVRSRCVRQAASAVTHDDHAARRRDVAVERRAPRTARDLRSMPAGAGSASRSSAASPGTRAPRPARSRCEPNRSSANIAAAVNAASSVNRWLAPRPGDPRRVEGRAPSTKTSRPEERHRRGQVGGHRLARVVEADGLAAEPRLEADEQRPRRATATGSSGGRGGPSRRGTRRPGSGSR